MHPLSLADRMQSSGAFRTRLFIAAAGLGALIAGCQAGPSADHGEEAVSETTSTQEATTPSPSDSLHELVHRYVLASPLLDECVDEWGLGPQNRFELTFELQPSGELIPLGVKDGDEELNECLEEAVTKLRLPEGTVSEAKSISISHR